MFYIFSFCKQASLTNRQKLLSETITCRLWSFVSYIFKCMVSVRMATCTTGSRATPSLPHQPRGARLQWVVLSALHAYLLSWKSRSCCNRSKDRLSFYYRTVQVLTEMQTKLRESEGERRVSQTVRTRYLTPDMTPETLPVCDIIFFENRDWLKF